MAVSTGWSSVVIQGAAERGQFEVGAGGIAAILVGTDDSVTATRAAWYAAGLARRQRARLIAVYVLPMAGGVAGGPPGPALLLAPAPAPPRDARAAPAPARPAARGLGRVGPLL